MYKVDSFGFLRDGDIPKRINAELEKLGLDASNVINIVHFHQGVIVYYRMEKE